MLAALAPGLTGIRLTIHVLAASIWVGGQIVVVGLLPTVRSLGEDAPRRIARAFAWMQWPAYVVLIVTGIWNIAAVRPHTEGSTWSAVLGVKITVVLLAGIAAFLHQRAKTRSALAIWGSIAGTTSLLALALGVFLAG